jgi:hypothetical protein
MDFVTSLILDGKDANVVNFGHRFDVEAGNDLVLRLKMVPLPPGNKYTLNHYAKGLMEKSFSPNLIQQINVARGHRVTHIWQLVPDVFTLDLESHTPGEVPGPNFMPFDQNMVIPSFRPPRGEFVWQQEGYWHIARAQIHCKKYGTEEYYYNDLANNLRTGHMDLTFQPTFLALPFRDVAAQGAPAIFGAAGRNVFNVIGEEFLGESSKRQWHNSLRLERGFEANTESSVGSAVGGGYDSLRAARGGEDGDRQAATKRIRFMGLAEPVVQANSAEGVSSTSVLAQPSSKPASQPSFSFDEDIGTMEDAGPLLGRAASVSGQGAASSFATESSAGSGGPAVESSGERAAAPTPQFSVPKPGLKSAKRPPARGKGVVGAVLAPDGSVTHEPSRML